MKICGHRGPHMSAQPQSTAAPGARTLHARHAIETLDGLLSSDHFKYQMPCSRRYAALPERVRYFPPAPCWVPLSLLSQR